MTNELVAAIVIGGFLSVLAMMLFYGDLECQRECDALNRAAEEKRKEANVRVDHCSAEADTLRGALANERGIDQRAELERLIEENRLEWRQALHDAFPPMIWRPR